MTEIAMKFTVYLRAGFKGGGNWAVAQGPPQKNSKKIVS